MRQLIENVRSMAPAGQRRLALAIALATTVLAAGAIFLLHRSMPVPVPVSDAPTRTAAGKPPPTVTSEDNAGPQQPTVPPEAHSPLTRESGAPVSLRVPMPEPDDRGDQSEGRAVTDGPRRERASGLAAPSAANTRATSANRARPADKTDAQTRKRTPADATATSPQKSGASADAGTSPSVVPAPAAAPTPAAAAAPSQPQRLAGEQQAQCAGSEFISRFICNERVRLRFCRDRWNEHPDCKVETTTSNH